ncbi:MAG TPA: hypothetical protein VJK25_03890 [Patescibacteria group bacterium]|nr:hypothetical protein [Patescibacteria group bacterium]
MLFIIKSLKEVFSKGRNVALFLILFLLILLLTAWLPNLDILRFVFASAVFSLTEKFSFLLSLLASLRSSYTVWSQIYIISLTMLVSLNLTMLVYYFSKKAALGAYSGLGLLGVLSGILGIGCLSCGSVILASIFGLTATVGLLGVLPLGGNEFGLIGFALMILSIYLLSQKIQSPIDCDIK